MQASAYKIESQDVRVVPAAMAWASYGTCTGTPLIFDFLADLPVSCYVLAILLRGAQGLEADARTLLHVVIPTLTLACLLACRVTRHFGDGRRVPQTRPVQARSCMLPT